MGCDAECICDTACDRVCGAVTWCGHARSQGVEIVEIKPFCNPCDRERARQVTPRVTNARPVTHAQSRIHAVSHALSQPMSIVYPALSPSPPNPARSAQFAPSLRLPDLQTGQIQTSPRQTGQIRSSSGRFGALEGRICPVCDGRIPFCPVCGPDRADWADPVIWRHVKDPSTPPYGLRSG